MWRQLVGNARAFWTAFWVAAVVLAVAAVALALSLREWYAAQARVAAMQGAIVAAAMQGYLLTRDPAQLALLEAARPVVRAQSARLGTLLADDPERAARAARIVEHAERRVAQADAVVTTFRDSSEVPAEAQRPGRTRMERLRAEVGALQADLGSTVELQQRRQRWLPLAGPGLALLASVVVCFWLASQALARQQAERAAWARLRGVLANSPVGLCFLDMDFRFRELNPALALMGGGTPDDYVGREAHEFAPLADFPRLREILRSVVDAARVYPDVELEGRAPDAKESRIYQASFFPLRVEGRAPEGVGLVLNDITDRKRVQAELAQARDAAEAANRAKSQFIANMSHELRTPLSAVIGYSEMLEEEVAELGQPGVLDDLRKIESNARHLLALINDVLDLSKIEAGRMEVHPERFDVGKLVDDAAGTVQALVARRHNRLVVEKGPDLGAMRSDLVKVRQCLFNLLSNAAKFTEHGEITLRAERVAAGGPAGGAGRVAGTGPSIVFTVRDTGIGMTQEQLGKLFERFVQADASTTRKFGGSGLGLAITRAFCRMLGGEVAVDSDLGRGTTFTIRLPVDVSAHGPDEQPAAPVEAAAELHPDEQPLDTVLVIDDDPNARELLSRFLRREGFGVRTAADGESGLATARLIKPAAILLDVMMPHVDGWAVLSALKADPEVASIPVVMITFVQQRGLGFSLGAADYVSKPIDWQRLREVLERYRGASAARALVVSEDEATCTLLKDVLVGQGWSVTCATDAAHARTLLDADRPDVALVDLHHATGGFRVVRDLRRHEPWREVPIVVLCTHELTAEERERLRGQVRQVIGLDDDLPEELGAVLRRIAARRAAGEAAAAVEPGSARNLVQPAANDDAAAAYATGDKDAGDRDGEDPARRGP
jgi:PAS domain S-box-containing protein